MVFYQKSNPPAYKFHPELAYLSPSRQLRQNVRMGLAAATFGIIAGLAVAMMLFPRPRSDLAWTESALATIPPGPVMLPSPARDSAPPPRPVIAPRPPAGATVVKEMPPAAPTRQTVEAPQAVPPPVQAVPAVTSDLGTVQASVLEHSWPMSRKARSHRRARR